MIKMENKEIYAVMVVGQQTPSVAFNDYIEAENEAKRLVKKERKPAYVLKAVAFLEEQEVKVTIFDDLSVEEKKSYSILDHYRKENSK
jgi:hypothetical protein